jgi:AcrR family transcriptional regulator
MKISGNAALGSLQKQKGDAMLNIDTLDNVIALVVVILILSLIVQSIQGLIKKLLRIKSKQIEESLLDLFDAVLRGQKTKPTGIAAKVSAMAPRIFPPSGRPTCGTDARNLLDAVKQEMAELGRVDSGGRFTMDSLSKSDLLNVIARVGPDAIVGTFTATLQTALTKIAAIETALKNIVATDLPGESNALFAKLQDALAPLRQHYQTLMAGGNFNTKVVVADVLTLREVVFGASLDLLAHIQKIVAVEKMKTGVPAATLAALANAETALAAVSKAINDAREALDDTLGSFKAKLTEIEHWFDTTMQSFEERYHRGMRTWSMVIAAVVVIALDANVFSIYRNVAKSDLLRNDLMEAGAKISQKQEAMQEKEKELDNLTKKENEAKASSSSTATATDTTATNAPAKAAALKAIDENKKEINDLVDQYTGFGFEPLTWKRVRTWINDLRTGPFDRWIDRRANDLRRLFGWLVMALLLSLGAPFWHDALESLFGVKNLLRRRNEQQNIEQARGAGNPQG